MNELLLKPIGYFESCYKDKFAIPRQPGIVAISWGKIQFNADIQPELSLEGLSNYSHLWIIFGFHLNTNQRYHAKVHPPRLGGATVGALASRTPHRPNPIGLSLVKLGRVNHSSIEVLGADIADQTPVYDIKPYLPRVEAIPDAVEGWSGAKDWNKLQVKYDNDNLKDIIAHWSRRISQPNLEQIIFATIAEDPRPTLYKDQNKTYLKTHAFRLFDGDIHFIVEDVETSDGANAMAKIVEINFL